MTNQTHRVPLDPECDKGGGHKNYSWKLSPLFPRQLDKYQTLFNESEISDTFP